MARPSWDQEHHKPEVTTTLNDWGSKQDSRDPVPSDDDEVSEEAIKQTCVASQ